MAEKKKTKKTKDKVKTKAKKKATKTKKASKKKSIEDRRDHRVPIQLLVDYKADGHYLFDFCRDLGAGGVFIQTDKPLKLGSAIDLTFTIPDSKETLSTNGTVIWVQGKVEDHEDQAAGMGVQFSGFSESQRKALEQFVSRYHGDAGEGQEKRAS